MVVDDCVKITVAGGSQKTALNKVYIKVLGEKKRTRKKNSQSWIFYETIKSLL